MIRTTITAEFPPAAPTSVTAWRYRLSERASGAEAGTAVVCVEARYATVRWEGAGRLERLHFSPDQWRVVESEGATCGLLVERIRGERGGAIVVGAAAVMTITAVPTAIVGELDGATGA